ncbi:MAG: UDP-N-acetylmuramoyl-tripeptide--D-alanyl-D-alanine ligase [Methylococcales symbiont of Hymedesmia sp. n. MRB-2018]|nr:MAG: UDP-N-acetylmuramoyl-tripeptide--D-alanyl-D-alanine ligase [Methylococcales symbiont of Hymedesmia sp. n. MRB-2018]
MNMLLSEIARHVNGVLSGEDISICASSIDTRTLNKGDLYIAIKGKNFDGHSFIDKAELAGADAVLVEKKSSTRLSQIVVKDSHLALAELAGGWKQKANVKSIAITGSNGKTTVKEMIASILSLVGNVLYTQGNLNNDIGVPLTLLKLHEQHQYAVIEVGANHVGEIAYSCSYVSPDVAVINNVGSVHIEGFGSIDGVAKAKGEIIQSLAMDGVAVLNRDDAFYKYWKMLAGNRKCVTFGLEQEADCRAEDIQSTVKNKTFKTRFKLVTGNEDIEIQLNLAGQHNVLNALAATVASRQLGIGLKQIKQGLEQLKPVTGRLQPLAGKHGGLVIDDTYNANPNSVKAALNVLLESGGEPWVILGALAEMGSNSLEIHRELGKLIKSMNVVRLLTIGSDAEHTSSTFGKGATFFSSQEKMINFLKKELKGCESVLVKGSRAQKMENIVSQLVTEFRT